MLVERPRRESDDIALAPNETLAVDDRCALTLDDVIDRASGMPVRLGALARPQKLRAASHRRQYRAARLRVAVFQRDAVESTAFMIAQRIEGFPCFIPRIEQ